MQRRDFAYELPPELIAQKPHPQRSGSRLLCLAPDGGIVDHLFTELPDLLVPGDLLVVNDTRVIPARLYGNRPTGGRIELLIEEILPEYRVRAQLRASKTPRVGEQLRMDGGFELTLLGRDEDFVSIGFPQDRPVLEYLEQHGHVPLPPYINRADEVLDKDRYQTIYARNAGAVAAPTAGLHFDAALWQRLAERGIRNTSVTLHVGAGTFQPMRAERVEDHRMHKEWLRVDASACAAISAARARGGRVIAVGTTTVRSLETAARGGVPEPYEGYTDLFITPGCKFRSIDAMITNFHLPESTLLMLVCAFGGYAPVMRAYRHAVQLRYRFFSYGDAMFLSGPALVNDLPSGDQSAV